MSNITVSKQKFSLVPTSFAEAMEFSKVIATSDLAPKDFKNKPGNIIVAIQMGNEIGLNPMQALQNISIINGRPCVWGDAALALVQASPNFENIQETVDDNQAVCIIKRRDQTEHTEIFTKQDAINAGLWNKVGPWKQYPKRMMQMRARGFALRNKFADVLMGLNIAEEVRDYIDVTPAHENASSEISEVKHTIEYAGVDQIVQLKDLFEEHNVGQESIDKWLDDSGVLTLEELPKSKIMAAINKLESKVYHAQALNGHHEGAMQ